MTCLFLLRTEQEATQLVILTKADMKSTAAANAMIPNVIIQVQDAAGNRIYSGTDAALVRF